MEFSFIFDQISLLVSDLNLNTKDRYCIRPKNTWNYCCFIEAQWNLVKSSDLNVNGEILHVIKQPSPTQMCQTVVRFYYNGSFFQLPWRTIDFLLCASWRYWLESTCACCLRCYQIQNNDCSKTTRGKQMLI